MKANVYDINYVLDWYEYPPNVSDIKNRDYYKTIVNDVHGAEKFNYHSDYWGCADYYQEQNIELIQEIERFVGSVVSVNGVVGELVGIAIDRDYNSISHTDIVLKDSHTEEV